MIVTPSTVLLYSFPQNIESTLVKSIAFGGGFSSTIFQKDIRLRLYTSLVPGLGKQRPWSIRCGFDERGSDMNSQKNSPSNPIPRILNTPQFAPKSWILFLDVSISISISISTSTSTSMSISISISIYIYIYTHNTDIWTIFYITSI